MMFELLGLAGFDAATIDLEHAACDFGTVRQMVMAAELAGVTPVVRIPSGQWSMVAPLLDFGVKGIQVPHIAGPDEARIAVQAVRYPPLGGRGALGFSRAARYGEIPWPEHVKSANEDVVLIVSVEDIQALKQIDAIGSVPGVDLVTIGAHDLAESMGLRGKGDPALLSAIENGANRLRAARGAGLALSIGNDALPLTMQDMVRLGVSYITLLPSVEKIMLDTLRSRVSNLRGEAER